MIDKIITHTYGLQILLTLIGMAVLNRAAGSDLYHLKQRFGLIGKPLIYVMPFMTVLVYWWYQDWIIAGAWAFAYWFWRTPAWGRWIDLNSLPPDHNRKGLKHLWYENIIEKLARGSDALALWIRSLFILPGMILIDYVTDEKWLTISSPIIAAALVGCYAVPKQLRAGKEYIWQAELACGALWGALFLIDLGV